MALNIDLKGIEGKFSTAGEMVCADCGFDFNKPAYTIRHLSGGLTGLASITCARCGKESFYMSDVKERYCGHCKIFHEDNKLPLLLWKDEHHELMLCLCWPCAQKRIKKTE